MRTRILFALGMTALTLATGAVAGRIVHAQVPTQGNKAQPVNTAPNNFNTIEGFFKLPAGRTWGSTSAVDVDKDGKTIWVGERCGTNSCLSTPDLDPVLHFDERGNLIKSFGKGMVIFPHGIHVDADGNIWVTDGNGNAPAPARGAGGGAAAAAPGGRGAAGAAAGGAANAGAAAAARGRGPAPFVPPAGATKGHQVFKFSPDGRVLMTIGKPGGAAPPECCYQPNDVITAPNGDIFVAEGHGNGSGLIFKFDKTGKLIKMIGQTGVNVVGGLNIPHSLAMDSRGRLFVANRGNTAISIFDQDGKLLEEWYQFSRISGLYIDKNDRLYAADSESSPTSHPGGWQRGIRIGSAKDGTMEGFIPDPQHTDFVNGAPGGTSAAEGVVADAAGNIYGAEVGPRKLQKHAKK